MLFGLKNKMPKYLYIVVETKVRELDSKILLTLEALKFDFNVIIGSKRLLHKINLIQDDGFFFYKDSVKDMQPIFEKLKFKNFKIIVHDEEGFVQWNWKDYAKRRIVLNSIKHVDLFFCWGKSQQKAINTVLPGNNLNTKIVGSPRIDILSEKIRDYNKVKNIYHKKVILINTKFGDVNFGGDGKNWIEKYKESNKLSDEEINNFDNMTNYKNKLLSHYLSLVNFLSLNLPNEIIILRPHPSENIEFWESKFKKHKNIIIRKDKSIGFWLHQSKLLIHSGCTTAIEGFLMEIPVIAFKPIENKDFEIKLPDDISLKCYSESQLLLEAKKIINGDFNFKEFKKIGDEILKNEIYIDENEFSFEKIASEINKLEYVNSNSFFHSYIGLTIKLNTLSLLLKLKQFFNFKNKKVESKDIVVKDEVIEVINKFDINSFSVDVTQLATNVVLINKKHEL
jgi:surface carbohydrate biosynthesis protein